MPTLSVFQDELARELQDIDVLKKDSFEEDFDELCFQFGIELDEVTSEWEQVKREQGAAKADECKASKREVYKIDIPANRYDLLCLEGLVQALRIFKEVEKVPKYSYAPATPSPDTKLTIKASTDPLRPYACGVILRDINFNEENLKSFIDLQDKLHHNVCRQRSLVSMGTHDLDKIEGPFTYECVDPASIKFAHLYSDEEMDGHGV